jgi:NAD(P)-dependent dehydrogenase (short-subunit alcohol dehydrogenase family)
MANTAKTAIVTGASRGIGAGLVEAFLKRGYSVVANSRNITKANPFAPAANVALVDGDIGDPRTAAKIVDTAVSRFGRIDVLINNAGVFIPKPFTEYTTEDFNTLVSTTLAGFLYVSQLAVKQMLRQKSGSIVNVSTTLVDQPIRFSRTQSRSDLDLGAQSRPGHLRGKRQGRQAGEGYLRALSARKPA